MLLSINNNGAFKPCAWKSLKRQKFSNTAFIRGLDVCLDYYHCRVHILKYKKMYSFCFLFHFFTFITLNTKYSTKGQCGFFTSCHQSSPCLSFLSFRRPSISNKDRSHWQSRQSHKAHSFSTELISICWCVTMSTHPYCLYLSLEQAQEPDLMNRKPVGRRTFTTCAMRTRDSLTVQCV